MPTPRKSQADHDLTGTKTQAHQDKPSLYRAGRPKIPNHLSRVARSEFKRIVGLLEERGTVTPGDLAIIALLAEVYSRWVAAKAQVGNDLMIETTVKDTNGEPVIVQRLNPLLKVVSDCERQIKSLTTSLGLTPLHRDKIKPAVGGRSVENEAEDVPGTVAFLIKHGANR